MYQDFSNLQFGRLTVIKRTEKNGKKNYWLCKCECGSLTVVETSRLKSGHTQSCGCLHREKFKPKTKDLKGCVFGKLTAIKRVNKVGERGRWFCKCECGKEKEVAQTHLISGKIRSCGCLFKENVHDFAKTHGFSKKERLYTIWQGMKDRCYNSNSSHYYLYGERGIGICEEWKSNYPSFREWAIKNGYNSKLTIDRIDNNKGYEPDNCRWISYERQNLNKRTNVKLTYKGQTKCISEWSKELGISQSLIRARIKKLNWSVEKALSTEVKK